jgi:hypothetical protein
MRLNDATIKKFEINQKDYSNSIKGFLKALINSEHFNAELIIRENYIIPAGFVKFTVDNGWVFANVSTKLSFGETLHLDRLQVKIYDDVDKENSIIESDTEVLYTINENDVEARLCFMVGSVFPYNGLKMVVPESRFVSLGTSNFPVKKLDEYDQMIDEPDEEPGTEPGQEPVDPTEPEQEPDPNGGTGDDSGAGDGEDTGD